VPGGGAGGSGQHEYEGFGALPVCGSFSTVDQVASSCTNGTLSLMASWNTTGGNNIEAYVESAPGSTPWDVYLKFTAFLGVTNSQFGIVLRNSTSAKVVTFGQAYTTAVVAQNWNNATSFSSNVFTAATWAPLPKWFRVHNDGTTLTLYLSNDGVTWFQFATDALSNFISSVNQVGFFVDPGGALQGAAWVQSFGTSAPN
jgi:hypothetical protein